MIVRTGSTSRDLGREIKAHWEAGKLDIKGAVVDAREGSNTPQTKTEVRGDYIGWFDGAASEGWAQGRDRKDYVSLPVSPHDHSRDPGCSQPRQLFVCALRLRDVFSDDDDSAAVVPRVGL